jgi:hypothetical protein
MRALTDEQPKRDTQDSFIDAGPITFLEGGLMRLPIVASSTLMIALAFSTNSQGADRECPSLFDEDEPYPTEVALLNEAPRGWTYRQSPDRLPLYFSDADAPGKSNCYEGCSTKWLPLLAPADAKPVGDWTVVKRTDGTQQWAHRKRPLYTRIHDSPQAPSGDGVDDKWHLLPFCP